MKISNIAKMMVLSKQLVPMALEARQQNSLLIDMPAADVIKMVNKECKRLMASSIEDQTGKLICEQLLIEKENGRELVVEDLSEVVLNQLLYKDNISEKRLAIMFNTEKRKVGQLKREYAVLTDERAVESYKEAFKQACKNVQNITELEAV